MGGLSPSLAVKLLSLEEVLRVLPPPLAGRSLPAEVRCAWWSPNPAPVAVCTTRHLMVHQAWHQPEGCDELGRCSTVKARWSTLPRGLGLQCRVWMGRGCHGFLCMRLVACAWCACL